MYVGEICTTHFFSFSFCFLALLVDCRLRIQLHLLKWSRFPECPWRCSCSCPSWVLQKLRLIQVTQPLFRWMLKTRCLPMPVSGYFRKSSAKGTHSVSCFHLRGEMWASLNQRVLSIPGHIECVWVLYKRFYVDQSSLNAICFNGRRNSYLSFLGEWEGNFRCGREFILVGLSMNIRPGFYLMVLLCFWNTDIVGCQVSLSLIYLKYMIVPFVSYAVMLFSIAQWLKISVCCAHKLTVWWFLLCLVGLYFDLSLWIYLSGNQLAIGSPRIITLAPMKGSLAVAPCGFL